MKTPTWEPTQGALAAWLLVNTQAVPVDLWTITLPGGTVLRYSGGDVPLTVGGRTWVLGPALQRSRVRQTIGVSVDSMSVNISADSSVLVGGVPILQGLAKGAFAGATVLLERGFFDAAFACKGIVGVFFGRLGAVTGAGRSGARFDVRSHAELLDVMVPSDVYQPACRNTVFDAQCGLSAAAFTVSGTAAAASDSTRRVITSTSAAVIGKPTAWADLGVLAITSGPNAGISRTVRTHTLAAGVATISAVYPFPFDIGAGATFTLRAGCTKGLYVRDAGGTLQIDRNGCWKFGPGAIPSSPGIAPPTRYRGDPFVPPPETVI